MSNETSLTDECCPKFDPSLWEGKTFNWENKKFIKGKVLSIFYMPINYGSVITNWKHRRRLYSKKRGNS